MNPALESKNTNSGTPDLDKVIQKLERYVNYLEEKVQEKTAQAEGRRFCDLQIDNNKGLEGTGPQTTEQIERTITGYTTTTSTGNVDYYQELIAK